MLQMPGRPADAGRAHSCIGFLDPSDAATPCGLPRLHIAISNASVTSWAVICELIDQPTIRRENRIHHGRHVQPAFVGPDVREVSDPALVQAVASNCRSRTFRAIACPGLAPGRAGAVACSGSLQACRKHEPRDPMPQSEAPGTQIAPHADCHVLSLCSKLVRTCTSSWRFSRLRRLSGPSSSHRTLLARHESLAHQTRPPHPSVLRNELELHQGSSPLGDGFFRDVALRLALASSRASSRTTSTSSGRCLPRLETHAS